MLKSFTDSVVVESEGSIASITLNRPDSLNALTFEMLRGLEMAFTELGDNPDIRAIILRGEGKAFCAGDDLIDMGTDNCPVPEDKIREFLDGYPKVCTAIRECPKPVVAVLHKFAMGAGLELALASDFIVASSNTKIGLPFVLRGFSSGTTLLPRLTNRLFANRLLLTGEFVPVSELSIFGLVTTICEPEDLDSEGKSLAKQLSSLPTKSISLMKQTMSATQHLDESAAWLMQAHSTVSSTLTEDHVEGRTAFREKRDPCFTGR
ncbi:enoyl-CoA hydratase/isomerase family protein [Corynebacterium sp. HMSC074H12]|uniref:enoyl-CoA hydratase/isomerase family protein n=1 Tax=Corynebacterium sp. HMSC074H12 TaxID=1739436 RepID=UPI0008B555AA|nr:enoyl-CoA hydratase-related protein [Corynebacterium sp. HMSC074H12]OFQ54358.1 hypothetical protein HMPREF2932_03965 [Corynebacterium sp. HMSC074H12]